VPFSEFHSAFDLLRDRNRIGKVVLEVSQLTT
jgi:MOSC domain-containing protein YiiM